MSFLEASQSLGAFCNNVTRACSCKCIGLQCFLATCLRYWWGNYLKKGMKPQHSSLPACMRITLIVLEINGYIWASVGALDLDRRTLLRGFVEENVFDWWRQTFVHMPLSSSVTLMSSVFCLESFFLSCHRPFVVTDLRQWGKTVREDTCKPS